MFPEPIQRVIDRVDRLRERVSDHWQIPYDEARVLAQLVRLGRCGSVCEVGTSYGFSTLHLAAAAREHGGHVHTFDIDPKKVEAARGHLAEAGLLDAVTLHLGDARERLAAVRPAAPFDFLFLDATKAETVAYLDAAWPRLAPRCVIAVDNTRTHPDALSPFVAALRARPGVVGCDVPVGNGFELALRLDAAAGPAGS